ncbi:MAG: hypothetical protein JSS82_13200 [Bacteroidetes bacterium]|nr:hypothetical protein [Bacteroidota bacterium]
MKSFLTACFMLGIFSAANAQNSLAEMGLKGNVKNLTETTFDNSHGKAEFEYKMCAEYDKHGNCINYGDTYSSGTSFNSDFNYKYDANGSKIEEIETSWRTVFTNDKAGRPIEAKRYPLEKDELVQTTVFTYDDSRNCMRETDYGEDGAFIMSTLHKFDDHNRLISRVIDSTTIDIMKGNKLSYKYDENGIMTEEVIYEPSIGCKHTKTLVKYFDTRIDSRGNWIKRSAVTFDGERTFKSSYGREISYY